MGSKRIAVIDIDGELLADCASVLADAVLSIVGSMPGKAAGYVRLIVQGDVLPDECEAGPVRIVTPWISVESYGSQRLRRITKFDIGDPVSQEAKAA